MATYTGQCSAVGSFTFEDRFTLYVELSNREGNPSTNKSIVDYHAYLENTSGGGTFTSQTRLYFAINESVIRDETLSVTAPRNGRVEIASGSIEVTHNDDGKKTIPFQALVQSNGFGISSNIQDNFTLTTIPRASSIGATAAYIEESTIINISRASSNFCHTIKYSFHNLSETIVDKTWDTTINWTLPESFYEQMPNQKSSYVTLTCITYSYDSENKTYTEIGEKTCTFTVNTNEQKCKPTLSATLVDINYKTKNLTGDNTKLIKYHSNAEITIICASQNGSTISSRQVNNISFTGDNITLEKVETNTFIITVTDSRGYSTSVTLNPEMVNYVPLTINSTIKRTQPTTGEVEITFTGNYFAGNFGSKSNTLGIDLFYREAGSSKPWSLYGAIIPTINSENNTYSNGNSPISLGDTFDYQKSYEFYLDVIDELTELLPTYTVMQGIPIFNWGKDFVNVNGKLLLKEVNLLELIFPIGSTYVTQTNTNPSTILGFGTWERSKGKVLIGLDESDTSFNTIGKTGGEKEHTLNINEMPSHTHNTEIGNNYVMVDPGKSEDSWGVHFEQSTGYYSISKALLNTGKGQPHNNLQPYEVVGYMWIRRS